MHAWQSRASRVVQLATLVDPASEVVPVVQLLHTEPQASTRHATPHHH